MSDNEDYFSNNDSDNESETSESELSFDNDDDNINNKRIDTDAKDDEDVDVDEDDDEEDDNYELENDDELEDEDEDDDDYDYENESQTGGADNDKEEELEKIVKKKKPQLIVEDEDEDDDDEEDMGESYLQKFNTEINKNYIEEYHPECIIHNHDEISALTKIIRDSDYNIIDPLHRTLPFLTKYEKTRIIGQRAKQINSGAKPFINVPENVIDGYLIAELELQQKRIPFIIRRPLNNGGSEYWNLKDLEIINF